MRNVPGSLQCRVGHREWPGAVCSTRFTCDVNGAIHGFAYTKKNIKLATVRKAIWRNGGGSGDCRHGIFVSVVERVRICLVEDLQRIHRVRVDS